MTAKFTVKFVLLFSCIYLKSWIYYFFVIYRYILYHHMNTFNNIKKCVKNENGGKVLSVALLLRINWLTETIPFQYSLIHRTVSIFIISCLFFVVVVVAILAIALNSFIIYKLFVVFLPLVFYMVNLSLSFICLHLSSDSDR